MLRHFPFEHVLSLAQSFYVEQVMAAPAAVLVVGRMPEASVLLALGKGEDVSS
jgi:hypothetical protein